MSEMKESKEIKEIRLGNVYNDEKYTGANFWGSVWDSNAVSPTMKTGASASQQCIVEPIVIGSMQEHASVRNDGICPTLTEAMGKGGVQTPMVMVKQATKDGYIPCEVGGGYAT